MTIIGGPEDIKFSKIAIGSNGFYLFQNGVVPSFSLSGVIFIDIENNTFTNLSLPSNFNEKVYSEIIVDKNDNIYYIGSNANFIKCKRVGDAINEFSSQYIGQMNYIFSLIDGKIYIPVSGGIIELSF